MLRLLLAVASVDLVRDIFFDLMHAVFKIVRSVFYQKPIAVQCLDYPSILVLRKLKSCIRCFAITRECNMKRVIGSETTTFYYLVITILGTYNSLIS